MTMTRRDAVTMAAGATAVLSLTALAEGKGTTPPPAAAKDAKPEAKAAWVINDALLAATLDCIKAGEACLDHCVRTLSTGDKSMAECAGTVRAMLPMCHAVADLTRLNSAHLKALAAVCAKVCRDCEAACKKHQNHHAECKACMESCQKCAAECEKAAA